MKRRSYIITNSRNCLAILDSEEKFTPSSVEHATR